MTQSVYLKLAIILVRIDIKHEERVWRSKVRRSVHDIPWTNEHLLKDIGLQMDGRPIGFSEPPALTAQRRVRHLRRILSARIPT
ncbi:DUF1127 domain-containing protein [Vibrio sp. AK197]|uniref:DUF1127 domain-containing protein n=1 Tax=Vibrio olivae TaxID=1243002 RepID=A0ABV5HNS1_9VIBR